MELRKCTQGICLAGAVVVSIAIVFDDMAVLFAGCILLGGVLGQYLVFDKKIREILASAEIARSVDRNPVRRGTEVSVTTTVTCRIPDPMTVRISDLLPAQASFGEGITTITATPDPAFQTYEMHYSMIPVIHGTQHFSGISFTMQNLFFRTTVILSRPADCLPALAVQPAGVFVTQSAGIGDATLDNRRMSVWSGIDVHSLRDYNIGDDLSHVDWKISAKYDKLVIRKYTAPINHPPLIIVDLPWKSAPYPEKGFNRMTSEVISMARQTILTYQHVSILIISGPNVLHLIRDEKNSTRCVAELRDRMHPAERSIHYYRMPDRSDIRSFIRSMEAAYEQASDKANQGFFLRRLALYRSILQFQKNPAFSGQISRALQQVFVTEAYLFSLTCGDTSHIRHVERSLKSQKIRVYLKIIDVPENETPSDEIPQPVPLQGGAS